MANWNRKIEGGLSLSSLPLEVDISGGLNKAIERLWTREEKGTLLAFADDGVIWGVVEKGHLFTARDAEPTFGPELRADTLWKVHLFSEIEEVRIWKEEGTMHGVLLTDYLDNDRCYFDEEQVLLGTDSISHAKAPQTDVTFTEVRDLAGQWHAPPIDPRRFSRRGLRLRIRNYLMEEANTGMLYIAHSRIMKLTTEKEV